MTRPSKKVVAATWMFTLACCAGTLWLGFSVIAAMAVGGLFTLVTLGGSIPSQVGNHDLLLALAPSAVAVVANVWVLWGRNPANPGVSPWWLAPALAIAVGTFAFGTYVCIDVWQSEPEPRAEGQTGMPTSGQNPWDASKASTRARTG